MSQNEPSLFPIMTYKEVSHALVMSYCFWLSFPSTWLSPTSLLIYTRTHTHTQTLHALITQTGIFSSEHVHSTLNASLSCTLGLDLRRFSGSTADNKWRPVLVRGARPIFFLLDPDLTDNATWAENP